MKSGFLWMFSLFFRCALTWRKRALPAPPLLLSLHLCCLSSLLFSVPSASDRTKLFSLGHPSCIQKLQEVAGIHLCTASIYKWILKTPGAGQWAELSREENNTHTNTHTECVKNWCGSSLCLEGIFLGWVSFLNQYFPGSTVNFSTLGQLLVRMKHLSFSAASSVSALFFLNHTGVGFHIPQWAQIDP